MNPFIFFYLNYTIGVFSNGADYWSHSITCSQWGGDICREGQFPFGPVLYDDNVGFFVNQSCVVAEESCQGVVRVHTKLACRCTEQRFGVLCCKQRFTPEPITVVQPSLCDWFPLQGFLVLAFGLVVLFVLCIVFLNKKNHS
uniref:Uncharacterized protein n=1 Tax=Bird gammacoronavirus AnasCN24 TaxID=3237959 RepID=A0AB39AF57_9GAMC